MNTFQTIVLSIAVLIIVVGVVIFATTKANERKNAVNVTVWGMVDTVSMDQLLDVVKDIYPDMTISYQYVEPSLFNARFVEALASGTGPDLVLLPQDLLVQNENKLFEIPYQSYPLRDFQDTFVEEGELFATKTGILGLPFSIDPLVTYWNRDLFTDAGIAQAPSYWDEIPALVSKLTKADTNRTITQSALALGEFSNVIHAKEILAALILQAGNPIVSRDAEGYLKSVMGERGGNALSPAEAALNFFTQFANPTKDVYSWNRSLPTSQNQFIAGDLALYFGFASEIDLLRQKNPNLNFDVASFLQSRTAQPKKTFGRMTAIAITKNTANVQNAFTVANVFTSPDVLAAWADISGLPPVRRDMLVAESSTSEQPVFYDAAIKSRGFLDPEPTETEVILQNMVELVTSGRSLPSEAVSRASSEIELLLSN